MRILVSNDDGYAAQGIAALAGALSSVAEVTVVAPGRDRSGSSNSITVHRPLHIARADNGFYYVDGKPADCVHLALTALLDVRPDLVVSGINHGSNLGDDTIYSGTVAAAREAYLLGIPGIAVSLSGHSGTHFDTAAAVARDLVRRYQSSPPAASPWLLNVNIPDRPSAELQGIRTVRLGKRHHAEPAIRSQLDNGTVQYRIGPVGAAADAGPDTDFGAIAAGFVSITPLTVDLTQFDQLHVVSGWLS